ncbi:MAG: ribosome biogenesis GTPase Der [Phycisphaerae bacterium]|nr:ribosome biogenesis GTPase Der [Phycisphaerae bacterium]
MSLRHVVIVGRPNVGKSSLLNFLTGRLISIVDPTAGVTRDRISSLVTHAGRTFELTDTGGYGIANSQELAPEVQTQLGLAIEGAELLLFVLDLKDGPTALDRSVAAYLRPFNKPVLLVANKADGPRLAANAAEFFSFGFGEPISISCRQNRGRDKLLDAVVAALPPPTEDETSPPTPELKLAFVGKRNAGKSTLVNTLAGENRVIVSDIPGTTRDSVDVRVEVAGRYILIIDTAGVRKRSKMTSNDLEFYSFHRAQRSIRRADVVFLLLDATQESGDVDQKIAAYIAEEFKPVIIVVNKWDLVAERASLEQYSTYIGSILRRLDYAPIVGISAKEGLNIEQTVHLAFTIHAQAGHRLTTGQLNQAVEDILQLRGPSSPTTRPVKVYYATQIGVYPPTIVLFVNNPDLITEEYRRFFVRQLRARTVLTETPIRLYVRSHHRGKEPRPTQSPRTQVERRRPSTRN